MGLRPPGSSEKDGPLLPQLSNPRQVTTATEVEGYPSWRPDGTQVAYESNQSGNWDIWVTQVSGRTGRQPYRKTTRERTASPAGLPTAARLPSTVQSRRGRLLRHARPRGRAAQGRWRSATARDPFAGTDLPSGRPTAASWHIRAWISGASSSDGPSRRSSHVEERLLTERLALPGPDSSF